MTWNRSEEKEDVTRAPAGAQWCGQPEDSALQWVLSVRWDTFCKMAFCPFLMEAAGTWGGKARHVRQLLTEKYALKQQCSKKEAENTCRTILQLSLLHSLSRQLEHAIPRKQASKRPTNKPICTFFCAPAKKKKNPAISKKKVLRCCLTWIFFERNCLQAELQLYLTWRRDYWLESVAIVVEQELLNWTLIRSHELLEEAQQRRPQSQLQLHSGCVFFSTKKKPPPKKTLLWSGFA